MESNRRTVACLQGLEYGVISKYRLYGCGVIPAFVKNLQRPYSPTAQKKTTGLSGFIHMHAVMDVERCNTKWSKVA
jgi:hypothetical protein